mgnify:FL=1
METMTQALLRKPRFPLLDHQRSEDSPMQDQGRPDGQGGLRGWERASNFNNFMNNSIPGYAIQGLMPGGIGLGLAARANNSYANNAYTNAMNSREGGGIVPQAPQPVRTTPKSNMGGYGAGMSNGGWSGDGGYGAAGGGYGSMDSEY